MGADLGNRQQTEHLFLLVTAFHLNVPSSSPSSVFDVR